MPTNFAPISARQPGLTTLDGGDGRIHTRLSNRGNSNYLVGVVGVRVSQGFSYTDGFRMFEITNGGDGARVKRTSVVSSPDYDLIMPSLDAQFSGPVAVGFTITGPSRFPSAGFVTTRFTGDNGPLTFSPVTITRAGVDTFQGLDSNNENRWGEYSATVSNSSGIGTFWNFPAVRQRGELDRLHRPLGHLRQRVQRQRPLARLER